MKYSLKYLLLVLLALTMWTSSSQAQEGFGLQLIKDGTPVAEANGPMNYTMVVFNNSVNECEDPICTVILTDTLPAGFVFQSVTATKFFSIDPEVDISGDCIHNNGTNTLTCDLGEFQVAEGCGFFCVEFPTPFVELQVVGLAPPGLGPITNNAIVEAVGLSLLDGDTASFDTNVVGSIPEPDLVISKADAVDPIIGGTTATYNLTVFNAGNQVATNAFIRDIIPPGGTFNPGLSSAGCVEGPPGRVTCPLGPPIPPGGFRIRNIAIDVGDPPVPTVIQNIARVFSDEPDSDPSSNITIEPTQVVPSGPAITESDMVVTKTSPETVIIGEQFFYTVNIFNGGPDDADNVRFRDAPFMNTVIDIPGIISTAPVNCVGLVAPNFRCDLINPLPAGQSVTLIIPATYIGPLPIEPLPIFNVGNVILGPSNTPDTVQVDPVPGNNTNVRVTNVVSPPPIISVSDLVITKAGADIVVPGEEIAYNIEVTNLGPDTAQNVVVRDIIPEFVTFNSFPGDCSDAITPGELICNIGSLANGEVRRIGIRATYNGPVPPLPLFRPIFNLAHVDFGPSRPGFVQIDPETADNTVVALTRAIAEPPAINLIDLFLVKTDSPDPVVVEEEITYNLNIYNFGPTDAVGVVVTDTLPPSVTNINAPAFCAVNANVVTCQLPNPIPAGGGLAIVPITVIAPEEPGMILNAAQTFADPFALLESDNIIQIDFAPSNNTDSEKTTVVPVPPPLSDLLITKSDTPDPVIEEDTLTYTIFVKNLGPDPAYGVLVSDWLSQLGIDLNTVTFLTTPNVLDCVQNPDFPIFDEPYRVECEIPFLGVEESAEIIISVQTLPLPNGFEFLNIFNLAKVQSLGDEINPASADPNPLNNVVVESTLIGPFVPVADVFVIKSDSPDPVQVDRTLTYVLFASNAGPDPATNVVITDTLPDSADFVSVSPNQGSCNYDPVAHVVTCNIGNLAVGAFTEVRLEVTPRETGTILNVAQIEADEHDPKSSNNTSPQTTTVTLGPIEPPDDPQEPNGPDLFVLKFVSPNPAEVGDEILYTIIVGNNGTFGQPATLIDDLPTGVTFIEASSSTGEACGFDSNNGRVTCDIGNVLPLGQGETVVIEVLVRADITGTLPNIAFLDNVQNDPNSNNNVSIVAVDVVNDVPDTPQATPVPDTPTDNDGGGNTTGGNGNSGCAIASNSVDTSNSAFNMLLLMLPLLVFGFRTLRRKK